MEEKKVVENTVNEPQEKKKTASKVVKGTQEKKTTAEKNVKTTQTKKKATTTEGKTPAKEKSPSKSIEEVVKQLKTVEKQVKEVEKTEVEFVADAKEKAPKDYALRVEIAARYSDEQAKNLLRKKISGYKEVHLRFLQKIEDPSAFKMERLFVPVHCGKTDVRYTWTTKADKVESSHEEICTKEKRFSSANDDLDVTNFLLGDLPQVEEKKKTALIDKDAYTFKKTVRMFHGELKATAPAKRATMEKRDETYALVYVPVMKMTVMLDGEKYIGYVNLHNGSCYSAYKVSDVLERAAEKSVLSAKLSKRTLWGTFLFSLTFCLLTLLAALKVNNWNFGSLTTKTVWVSCVLAALALPSLALMVGISNVDKDHLIEKAIKTGKTPGVAWARFAAVVGMLCTVGTVLLFFFEIMI